MIPSLVCSSVDTNNYLIVINIFLNNLTVQAKITFLFCAGAIQENNPIVEHEDNIEANSDQNVTTMNSSETSSSLSRDFDLNLPASHSVS